MNTPAESLQNPPRKRRFRTEDEWRELIRQFEESGQTQSAFCKLHGIATSGLHNWRKRLAGTLLNASTRSTDSFGFVPLGMVPESSSVPSDEGNSDHRWQMELEFAPGRTLKITLA